MKNTMYKILISLLLMSFSYNCKIVDKEKDENNPFASLILLGAVVRMDTLLRVENQSSAPVRVQIYDNSTCNSASNAIKTGMPVYYDFGTVAANSKSDKILSLPFSTNTQFTQVTMYVQFTVACNFPLPNQIDASSLSNAKGYLLQIKPASGGGNYLEVDPRSGFYSYPAW
ncbi:hypothetical protein [Leptospira santarosai]|uniref:hypothetical protein n=1 Tax=Leptospira santarosai TaxID=28183 RepID=UPI0002BFC0F0|nr:hypothetical protein [Leptospira santarosai]EMO70741.1 hypothetical protein LEP1GSC130_0111 [Leptospira santarosai str. 200403458]EMO99365.1 hypothetical protein LEP1GSC120_2622 [Leptospira santarosai str. 200702252]